MLDAQSFWDLVARRAAATPDAPLAVDEAGRELSFAGYRDGALRCAAALCERGVAAGTPVSWQLPTSFEALILTAALARLGAVQNPVLPIYRHRELAFVLRWHAATLSALEARRFDALKGPPPAGWLRLIACGSASLVTPDAPRLA